MTTSSFDSHPTRTATRREGKRTRRLSALIAIPVWIVATGWAATLATSPVAHATCNDNYCGDLPEWYQFCKNRTPGSTMSDRTQYFYKGAPASSSGVDCQYAYAGFMGFFPQTKVIHYSWSQVCSALRIGNDATWDGQRPHCKS